MTHWAGWAAAVVLLLVQGCASLAPPAAPGTAPRADAPDTADAPVAVGPVEAATNAAESAAEAAAAAAPRTGLAVRVEIDAPGALAGLLERNLDIVRLGRLARTDVDDSEWARLIDATPAQVRDLLQTEGYFDPLVLLERQPGTGPGDPDVVKLAVSPGARAKVTRLTLEADGELQREAERGDADAQLALADLRRAWPLQVGDDFRNPAWADAKAATLARLRGAGYAGATWAGTGAEVDAASNTVRLFLVIDSGPLFRYGVLQVDGLVQQEADTVRNLAAFPRGAPVTESLLLDFQERLQTAGLFESVTVTLDTDPAQAGQARILVRLREAPLQVYTFGIGVSTNSGPRASVEHLYRRVFGYALTARNKAEWGTRKQSWDGELSTHPGRGMYRNLLGGAVEFEEFSNDESLLSQRIRLGRTTDTARIERLYFLQMERTLRRTPTTRTDAFATSFNYHGVWRDLDSPILPTEGFTFAGQGSVGRSHGSPAAAGVFGRAYGRLTYYTPLGRTWYGQARLESGQVFVKEGVAVPETQLFRAGGDDSVRGYGYRSLGVLQDGVLSSGKVMLTSSLEVARPLSVNLPALWGALFVDVGNVANSFKNIEYMMGYGLGLRWRSPVGPLRLDWAWARETRKGRLHFSVGIAF